MSNSADANIRSDYGAKLLGMQQSRPTG